VIDAPPGLAELVIANARRYATGVSLEVDGPNDGPDVREWLLRRGIDRPAPWCAAGACAWIEDAARAMGYVLQLHRSAGALRLLALNPELVIAIPEVGCIEVEDHGHGFGHVKIVTGLVLVDGVISSATAIAGNTSADGVSRNGDRVAERETPYPNPRLVGYVRVA